MSQDSNTSSSSELILCHQDRQQSLCLQLSCIEKTEVAYIFGQALFSLKLAEQLIERLKELNVSDFNLTIHVDVGPNGETKKIMQEIVGMIKGNGFAVKTKPDSYGASSVADRHT
jgi:predicted RNase H-related nuclease YkuK (DUF458 family)